MIDDLQRRNEKAHYIYRALLLFVYALIVVLYLRPVPTYLRGQHPKSHMTMFIHPSKVGGVADLTYLPAFPIYLAVTSWCFLLIYGAAYELMDLMRLVRPKSFTFPAQPHPFGTAPFFLVPVLRDIRLQHGGGVRTDQPVGPAVSSVFPPRIVYVGFLWVCTWPAPLLTFGIGAFDDAAWWAIPSAVMTIHVLIEWWIYKAERDTIGLSGMKYAYKGA